MQRGEHGSPQTMSGPVYSSAIPSPTSDFARAGGAAPTARRTRPAPVSVRFTAAQRATLERPAGSQPLGTYIKEQLFAGDGSTIPRGPRKPKLDHAVLGQLLGALGKSDAARLITLLSLSAHTDKITLTETDRAAVRQACADIGDIRAVLVGALCFKPGSNR